MRQAGSTVLMRRASSFAVGLVVLGILGGIALADDEYPGDLRKKHPAAYKAYSKVVPRRYRKVTWIYRLQGTAGPVSQADVGGKTFYLGMVCQPHDCGDNEVAYLIAADGSAAYGLLHSSNYAKPGDVTFGTPDEPARKLLEGQLTPP